MSPDSLVLEQPPRAADRTDIALPISQVTVLEDRAEIVREGMVSLADGMNRIRIPGVSPILRDVSLQVEIEGVAAPVVRAQRVRRIRLAERPEALVATEAERDALDRELSLLADRQARAEARHERLLQMTVSAAQELPEDASWGRGDPEAWRQAFDALFTRARGEQASALDAWIEASALQESRDALQRRIDLQHRPDQEVAAHLEIDAVSDRPRQARVTVRYTVASALWRPLHRAALAGDTLRWTPRAAVWQHTGEDWTGVRLRLSTARTAAGTEPPLLADDPLEVQRKPESVELAVREVEVQSTGPAGPPSGTVRLPGVDDGGEVRHLEVPGIVDLPSTGRPAFFDLPTLETKATVERLAMPEVLPRVVRKVTAHHMGSEPLLAGPVELLSAGGAFGWSDVGFTASGAAMELSFGPDDACRVQRKVEEVEEKTDPVDQWHRATVRVRVFLSNTGSEATELKVTERIPVSEVEDVRIEGVVAEPAATPDADGMLCWTVPMGANSTATVTLTYTVGTAPGIHL